MWSHPSRTPRVSLGALALLVACGGAPEGGETDSSDPTNISVSVSASDAGATTGDSWDPAGSASASHGTTASTWDDSTTEASTSDFTTGFTTDPDPTDITGTTGEPEPVCEPWPDPIPHPWIGAMCGHDDDCNYEDGVCLLEEEGFPCGTCSQPCDQYCPDLEGTPETFCVDSSDLGLAPPEGLCVSQCDPVLLGGNGCRPGYECVVLQRYNEPGVSKTACVPAALAPEPSNCLEELAALGAVFEPTVVPLDHPEGHPELDCIVEDPVKLYSPVAGVEFAYHDNEPGSPMTVSCEMAKKIHQMAGIMYGMDGREFRHLGTYNCRVISGTDELSMHGLGVAIDLEKFRLADNTWYSLQDDWEIDVQNPVTPGGQWLKALADARYAEMVFHIILTPNYNDAHWNHFHVDLTPGGDFYD